MESLSQGLKQRAENLKNNGKHGSKPSTSRQGNAPGTPFSFKLYKYIQLNRRFYAEQQRQSTTDKATTRETEKKNLEEKIDIRSFTSLLSKFTNANSRSYLDKQQQESTSRKTEKKNLEDKTDIRSSTSLSSKSPNESSQSHLEHQQQSTSTETEKQNRKDQCGPDPFETYKKLEGTKDQGREFEQAMCGYYALQLAISDDVSDFAMTSNDAQNGKFDDIGLTVTFPGGVLRRYLFQLKHKESKSINLADLKSKSKKNDFGLKTYIESISEMQLDGDTVCILSTNSSTKIKGNEQLMDGISIEESNQIEFGEVLVNTTDGQKNAIFEIKSDNLKVKFYVFSSQMNVKLTEEKVNGTLKSLLKCDLHASFASFIRNWWSGRFVLRKRDVILKISELVFSPCLKTLSEEKFNEKTQHLKEAIMSFPLTLVEEHGEDVVENIWKIEKSWTNEELSKTRTKYGLKEHQQNVILWYLGRIPLIVKVDRLNADTIRSVMSFLSKGSKDQKIVLSGRLRKKDFEPWDTFESLWDLIRKCKKQGHCLEILQKFNLSLQGRGCITLEQLVRIDEDAAKLIRTSELLKMSQQEYLLVGHQQEDLSKLHVPRNISPILVKLEDILDSSKSSDDARLIINCDALFANKVSERVNTMELEQLTRVRKPSNVILLSTKTQCTNTQFERICQESKLERACLLQQFDEECCILTLQKGRKLGFEVSNPKKTIRESDIFKHYNNDLHAFCAPPGMGKSTLMKILYNNCPPDFLAVYVNLINCNSLLAQLPDFEKILIRFLELDGTEDYLFKQLQQHFWRRRKLYLFLDGLDEVNSQHVESILNFVKYASGEGVKVWLSSRENLREKICQTLNVVPLDINELDREEQKTYIDRKLGQQYNSDKILKITTAVFNSTDLNNSQNLLGIPLQLHMITEIFLNDPQVYIRIEKKNIFVLTKMYKIFFEGKLKYACNKLVDENQEQQLGHLKYVLQGYEIPALKACLDEDDYRKLSLDSEENTVQKFLREFKTEGDKNGIIKKINENDQVVFDHQTYAEYFACVWFKKNRNKIGLLRDRILTRKYENLRLVFDIMLAANNPLHLAIIYKDVQQVESHIMHLESRDEGGRTAFHLAFSYGHKYNPFFLNQFINTDELKAQKMESSCYERMIERLLQEGKIPEEKDNLFHLDCVSYALQANSLYPLERMLARKLTSFDRLKGPLCKYVDVAALIYFCVQQGYPNLLTNLIEEHPSLMKPEDLVLFAMKPCGSLSASPSDGNLEVIRILINKIDITPKKINDILRKACTDKCFDILEILINKGAKLDNGNTLLHLLVKRCPETHWSSILSTVRKFNIDVNSRNSFGITALHCACARADLKIVTGLMEIGADFHTLDNLGRNLLHYATSNSRPDVVKFLLDTGMSVNSQDYGGETALHLAAKKSKIVNIKILLRNGARLDLADHKGNNAFHHALLATNVDPDVIKLLMDEGLDVNSSNDEGLTPLHSACRGGKFKMADLLLELGAKSGINGRFEGGMTLLHLVCRDGEMQIAVTLLERGADPNSQDNENRNPLYYYLELKYEEFLVHAMVNRGLNLNSRYKNGQTLLHIACSQCDTRTIRELVENGIDVNIPDDNSRTPLHIIFQCLEENDELISNLQIETHYLDTRIQHDHRSNELQFGCKTCYSQLAGSLQEEIFDGNFQDRVRQKFIFHLGHNERIDFFLEHVFSMYLEDNGSMRHIVARFIVFETINYLIENGAQVIPTLAMDYGFVFETKFPEVTALLIRAMF